MKATTRIIYKYHLPIEREANVFMPMGAVILTVKAQHGQPYIWAVIDPEAVQEWRRFYIFGTGERIDDIDENSLRYIDTVLLNDDRLVLHVFEG